MKPTNNVPAGIEAEVAIGTFGEYLQNPVDAKERMRIVARNLAMMRKEVGMSQKDVCTVIGCAPQTYSGYEKGKHEPTVETLVRLSHLYHVSVDFLVCRNEGTPNEIVEYVENMVQNGALQQLQYRVAEMEEKLARLQNP